MHRLAQVPSTNLMREAEMQRASIDPKKSRKHTASRTLFSQHLMITNDVRQVVTSITEMTAKLDAFPIRLVS